MEKEIEPCWSSAVLDTTGSHSLRFSSYSISFHSTEPSGIIPVPASPPDAVSDAALKSAPTRLGPCGQRLSLYASMKSKLEFRSGADVMPRNLCQNPWVIIGTAIIMANATQTISALVSRRNLNAAASSPTTSTMNTRTISAGTGNAASAINQDSASRITVSCVYIPAKNMPRTHAIMERGVNPGTKRRPFPSLV